MVRISVILKLPYRVRTVTKPHYTFAVDERMWDRKLCTFFQLHIQRMLNLFFQLFIFSFFLRMYPQKTRWTFHVSKQIWNNLFITIFFNTPYTRLAYNFVKWFLSVERFAFTYLHVVVPCALSHTLSLSQSLSVSCFVRSDNRGSMVGDHYTNKKSFLTSEETDEEEAKKRCKSERKILTRTLGPRAGQLTNVFLCLANDGGCGHSTMLKYRNHFDKCWICELCG